MAVILSLDTTTRGGSVAVMRDDQVLSLVDGDASRSHGERLPGEIEIALDRAGVNRTAIGLIGVASGPGAFTGLRIGLACAQGLSMTLNVKVIGVSTLDALAAQVADAEMPFVVPWMDAQRGDVFAALIAVSATGSTVVEPAVAGNPRAVLDRWGDRIQGHRVVFIGDAAGRDAQAIRDVGKGCWESRLPTALAPAIGRIARDRAAGGEAGLPHQLIPIYVRRPDAEIEREARSRT